MAKRQKKEEKKKRKKKDGQEAQGTLHIMWQEKGFSAPAHPFTAAFTSFLTTVLNFLNGWLALCLREMPMSCVNYLVMTNSHIYTDKLNKLADTVTHSECVHKLYKDADLSFIETFSSSL